MFGWLFSLTKSVSDALLFLLAFLSVTHPSFRLSVKLYALLDLSALSHSLLLLPCVSPFPAILSIYLARSPRVPQGTQRIIKPPLVPVPPTVMALRLKTLVESLHGYPDNLDFLACVANLKK